MKVQLKRLAIPLLLGAVAALGVTAPAAAAGPGEGGANTWQSLATSKCLDSAGDGHAYTLPCNGTDFQKWTWYGPSNYAEHRNLRTGLCLDSNLDGRVYTLRCNGGAFQHWARYGDVWQNAATGFCLDGNTDGSVYTHECNGGSFQRWI